MNFSYYMFAFFVFLLVCAAIWFFSKIYKGVKKEENNDYAKEQRLYKLYQNVEDMMNSFEEYAEESKEELDRKMSQIEQMADELNSKMIEKKETKPRKTTAQRTTAASKKAQGNARTENKRDEQIAKMIADGLDIDEIAKKQGMSRKQVSLILEVNKLKDTKRTAKA